MAGQIDTAGQKQRVVSCSVVFPSPAQACLSLLQHWFPSVLCCAVSGISSLVPKLADLTYLPLGHSLPAELQGKAGRLTDTASSRRRLWLAARSAALLATSVYLITVVGLPDVPRHFAYAIAILGFVTLLMDLPAAVLSGPLGLELIPSFDEPWLSNSLADFWGRRWNIPTASMLRCVVYDPIIEGRLVCVEGGAKGRQAAAGGTRKAAALAAAFIASGVMHEVIFLYVSPVGLTYKWLAFFCVQVGLMPWQADVGAAAYCTAVCLNGTSSISQSACSW
jgi:hypothetical protein